MEEIVVVVPAGIFARSELSKLREGIWKPAPVPGYSYRIDPENPGTRTMRHIHIAIRGYTDRAHQVAWNVDGSRHDLTSTGAKFTSVAAARRIARDVLKLSSNVVLEAASASEIAKAARHLMESHDYGSEAVDLVYFVAKYRVVPAVRARLVE